MIVDLRQFDEFPAQAVIEAQPGEIEPFDDLIVQVGKVVLDLSLQKAGEEYFCQGTVDADVRLTCSRCAEEYTTPLDGTLDFIIRTDGVPKGEKESVDDGEDYVYTKGQDMRVDVGDLVRQALILSLPMKPLCSEDCKGLCPVCRANLNERTCGCETTQIDPRWDDLRGLRKN